MFIYEFSCRRKIGQTSQTSATLADNLIRMGSFGAGRRERRGAGEEKEEGLLRTVDWVFKTFREFSVSGLARRSAGGGGFKGYRL